MRHPGAKTRGYISICREFALQVQRREVPEDMASVPTFTYQRLAARAWFGEASRTAIEIEAADAAVVNATTIDTRTIAVSADE